MNVEFVALHHHAIMPYQAYEGDAGWDLFALEDTLVPIGQPTDIRTGIAIAIPHGHYGRIVHRSSTPRKRGLMVLEGIIDSGFRGELFACAYTWVRPIDISITEFPGTEVRAGESIAQLIVQKVEPVEWIFVDELTASTRGERGFGSSGH